MNNFVTNIVALGLGPESGTRYSGTNSASGLAADLPIGPGASSLSKRLFDINKAFEVARLVLERYSAQVKGDWFKALLISVQLDQVKASVFEPGERK